MLRIVRLKTESIKLICIFIIFAVLFLLSSSISNLIEMSSASLANQSTPYIKLGPKEGREAVWNITDDMLVRSLSVEGVAGYNGLITAYALTPELQLIPGRYSGTGDDKANLTRLLGSNNSEKHEYFLTGEFILSSGSHVESDGKEGILISTALADRNNLSIGDPVEIMTSTDSVYGNLDITPISFSLTISGFFDVLTNTNIETSQQPECDIRENFIFTSDTAAKEILSATYEQPYERYNAGALFFTSSAQGLEQTGVQIIEQLDLSADDVSIIINDDGYSKEIEPLLRMNRILTLLTLVVVLAGSVITALVYFYSTKRRLREFGVLLSLGFSKPFILCQVVLEALVFMILSILAAAGIVTLLIRNIISLGIDMQITGLDIVSLAGYMLLLVAVVVIVVSIILHRNKPKDLLSHMI